MTPELYRRASDLFNELRDLPDGERPAVIDAVCGGDTELRDQVVRLLEADREAAGGNFLERRALEDAASLIGRDSQDLPPVGTILGNYRLGARIGAGGMGVVFEAQDLRLERRVAVKVLPQEFARERKDRVQRFKREARAASLLNHPNMVSVFDADFGQGWCYIAMEFVEGKTLRELLEPGALPVDAECILDWVGQAAAALTAAHKADIVHRDIKPENVMVRDDGFVKVLDFGLAKLREVETPPAEGTALWTRPGNLAGTIHYLSPEQILGEAAGPRSDLFSLGVVAYELATGVRPFDGPTDGAVFNAILNHEPALPSAVRPALGSELDGLIMRLLEKDPERRFQTASDFRSACRRLSRDQISKSVESRPDDAGPPGITGALPGRAVHLGRSIRLWPLAGGAGLVCAFAAAGFWLTRPLPAPRVTGIVQVTHDGLPKKYFVNDGARLYYAAGNENPEIKMFQVSAKGGDPVPMPLLTGMVPLDISADGSEMLLGQYEKSISAPFPIWIAATLGGPPRRLGDLTAVDARWSPSGDQIISCTEPELRIERSDGSESRVLVNRGYMSSPAWSPDGRTIRFTLDVKGVPGLWEVAADGTHLHALFPDESDHPREDGVWTRNGKYFLFSVLPDIWALTQGSRFPLHSAMNLVQLTNGPLMADRPQPTPDGRRIFFRGRLDRGELVKYDHQADRWEPYLHGLPAMQLDYSRDGKWIAYASYPNGSVWRCAADGSERLQLTTPPLFARNPRWSPDGTQIVFYGGAPGNLDRLYLVPAQGGAVRQLTHSEAGPTGDADGGWSPDGSVLVFGSEQSDQLANQPRGLPLSSIELGSGRVSKLPGSEGMWSPRWSPNGRYIAGMRTPQDALWLYNVATHERRQLTSMSASWPNWSRDGQFLYFGNNTLWYRVRIDDAKVQPVAAVNGLKTADGGLGWIGLTPDSALISTRDAGNTEIYALDWETP